ncbi:MAG: threonine ammonia-lyase [Caldilineaceae bacterium]
MPKSFSLEQVRTTRQKLAPFIRTTPVWEWRDPRLDEIVGDETQVVLKLELFQHTGSFKPRGALSVMLNLDRAHLLRGVTAVSAGNHAIAVAYAASLLDTSAKVVMPRTANPLRVERCRAYGAEVELVDDVKQAFARVARIQEEEGRHFVHPYEGPLTALGTGTIALEFLEQTPDLDAVVIPIGGGGLSGGMAATIKQMNPSIAVFGVEPTGADSMRRSLDAGAPQAIDQVRTIADSLGAPMALPYSYELNRMYLDDLVLVDDDQMREAMRLIFLSMKLAVEPAGAAATAALCGPLRERLAGKRVGIVICGANIDAETFARQILPTP